MDNEYKKTVELLKRGLKVTIEFQYNELLKSFLKSNPLADESFFIQYLNENQDKHLDTLKGQVNFYIDSESLRKKAFSVKTAVELYRSYQDKKKNDEYWYFEVYKEYLKERTEELSKSQNTNRKEENLTRKWNSKNFALFLIYLRDTFYIDSFDNTPTVLAPLCEKYLYTGSVKKLKNTIYAYSQTYNSHVSDHVKENDPRTKKNIKEVILLLSDYPKAKNLAENELTELEIKA